MQSSCSKQSNSPVGLRVLAVNGGSVPGSGMHVRHPASFPQDIPRLALFLTSDHLDPVGLPMFDHGWVSGVLFEKSRHWLMPCHCPAMLVRRKELASDRTGVRNANSVRDGVRIRQRIFCRVGTSTIEARALKIRSHPAALSASGSSSGFWSKVGLRTYQAVSAGRPVIYPDRNRPGKQSIRLRAFHSVGRPR